MLVLANISIKVHFEVMKMDLYKEIISKALSREEMQITFPNLKISPTEIVESECYQATVSDDVHSLTRADTKTS